jgi:hypothetical protein
MKRKVFTWGLYYLILIDEILLYNLIIMGSMAFDTLLARSHGLHFFLFYLNNC